MKTIKAAIFIMTMGILLNSCGGSADNPSNSAPSRDTVGNAAINPASDTQDHGTTNTISVDTASRK